MKITPTNMTRKLATTPALRIKSMQPKILPLLLAACLGATSAAYAAPINPTVVNGQVTFSQDGNVFSITNSPNAIINWGSFSISQGEVVRFLQQSSNSSVLNRITGQDPSRIMGALQSNGRVYLINPNGIVFGAGAQVNVNGLIASTLDIANADFLAGKNKFFSGVTAGSVVNEGEITTPSGGKVFLIAPDVTNSGIITSPQGEVVLAAGHSVQLADSSNPAMHVVLSAPTNSAINIGQVIAQGGKIGIYGAVVNQRGTLNANSAVVGENGKIILKSTRTTLLEAGSVTTATGAGSGGEVQVLGEQVGLMGNALVDVSGQSGGGTALIGGDYQGKNSAVMNAEQTFVDKDAVIKADAIASGDGGKVIVWGNKTAQVYGSIFALGGALSGNGGFVETSGHYLDVAGIRVNAGAANGKNGQWLLDPLNIVVASDGMNVIPLPGSGFVAFADDSGPTESNILSSAISSATANITLQATNDITFYSSVNIAAAGVGLTAQAGNNIVVNTSIATNGGAIVLSANDNSAGTASRSGRIIINSGGSVNANGGSVTKRDSISAPPSADICTIAPNSALCQVLSPPTASEPNKPVQQASNEVIKTVTTAAPKTDFDQVAFLDTKKTTTTSSGGTSGGSSATSTTPDDTKSDKTADKPADKSDTKEVASNDKSGTKNEPTKKMYCN
ncbi:filamentous hemagglutinin family protein [Herminiimonas fonticola]|uniref:Filamentous hemagglutinin family protein n=2 Tax=Herminiimonas fonticola TaxID=303380 RepID=A0A4R6GFJ5_9BURK|nr:filamentous hemagglutinin family N-terminal domain [Herminiimonas fonticola]TDN93669.1 filamentous hemagglutinin family protein [Herminiimonas fonticola]